MHHSKHLFTLGTLCLVLSLLLTVTALAHGRHGGRHHGGYDTGYTENGGAVYDSGNACDSGTGAAGYCGGSCGGTGRQWSCGGRLRQPEITVCPVEGCTLAGRHLHDGTLYCGYDHDGGLCSGACCGLCPVEGCTAAGRHLHDGMVYCGDGHAAGFCDGSCAVYHYDVSGLPPRQ